MIVGDGLRLEQIFINLIENVIKYGKDYMGTTI